MGVLLRKYGELALLLSPSGLSVTPNGLSVYRTSKGVRCQRWKLEAAEAAWELEAMCVDVALKALDVQCQHKTKKQHAASKMLHWPGRKRYGNKKRVPSNKRRKRKGKETDSLFLYPLFSFLHAASRQRRSTTVKTRSCLKKASERFIVPSFSVLSNRTEAFSLQSHFPTR